MSDFIIILISIGGAIYTIINLIALFETNMTYKEEIFNPLCIYQTCNVNWFGCFLLTLISNIILILPAIVYWFYKLCTVGRR